MDIFNPHDATLVGSLCHQDTERAAMPTLTFRARTSRLTRSILSNTVLTLSSLWLGTLLVAIDTTIISVAIPRISSQFRALDQIAWYGSAYLLTLTALQPVFGTIYQYFKAKLVYVVSIIIFEVGSIICAAAPSSSVFIVGRAVAGVGASGLLQGALSIITYTSPLEKRPARSSVVISVFGLAVCFGPIIGGTFTDHASWRWCFWINAPVGGVALICALLFISIPPRSDDYIDLPLVAKLKQIDYLGTTLLISAVCCLLLALQWGGTTYPWNSSKVIGLIVGFGVLTISFVALQYVLGKKASMPIWLMRQRSVLVGSIFLFFIQTSSYIKNYFLPFYFQAVQGVSVTTSGVRFIAIAIPQVFGIVATGTLVTATGHYVPFMILGQAIEIAGTYCLSRMNAHTSEAQWATFLVLTGLGLGMGQQLPYTAIQLVLTEVDTIMGNALATMFGQLGGAMASTVGESIFVNSLLREVPKQTSVIPPQQVVNVGASGLQSLTKSATVLEALREAYAKSIANTMYFSLGVATVAFFVAFGMEWLNVKTVAAARAQQKNNTNYEGGTRTDDNIKEVGDC